MTRRPRALGSWVMVKYVNNNATSNQYITIIHTHKYLITVPDLLHPVIVIGDQPLQQ